MKPAILFLLLAGLLYAGSWNQAAYMPGYCSGGADCPSIGLAVPTGAVAIQRVTLNGSAIPFTTEVTGCDCYVVSQTTGAVVWDPYGLMVDLNAQPVNAGDVLTVYWQ